MSNTSLGFCKQNSDQTKNHLTNNISGVNQVRPASRSHDRATSSHYSSNSLVNNKNLAVNNFKTGLK